MKRFRRQESFRYTFEEEILGQMKTQKVVANHIFPVESQVVILDVSPTGLKIKTDADLPIQETNPDVEISFCLTDKSLTVTAQPRWRKVQGASTYLYGFKIRDNEQLSQEIIKLLKEYSKTYIRTKKLEKKGAGPS